jgi:DNA-binding MarR family transcriptional regulator
MSVDTIFVALADPTRRGLYETLAQQPASVNELAARLPVTRGAVSQHLKILLQAGLVDVEPSGRRRIYRVRPERLQALVAYAQRPHSPAPAAADGVATELAKWQQQAPHIDHGALALLMYFTQIGQYVLSSNEEVAAAAGLRFSDIAVLGALRRLGPPYESTPTELSRTFWITLPGMTKRLARLETLGLLKRKSDPDDGRSVRLSLTAKGLATLQELVAHHQPPEYYALMDLPAEQRQQLSHLLAELLQAIDERHGQRRPPLVIR